MSRSPLAYPLNRAADTDVGGAADLQTDVMRFMAILALCLVAIFALVQSIPLTPVPAEPATETAKPVPEELAEPIVQAPPEPAIVADTVTAEQPARPATPVMQAPPPQQRVRLTRPKWVPKYAPRQAVVTEPAAPPAQPEQDPAPAAAEAAPAEPEPPGFVLRFASDAALMRAVAAHHVGVYAIEAGRARRMTVSDSRISFWDASMPNTFHEMETNTVPAAVVAALSRTAAPAEAVSWGVTLPGSMTAQLDTLMQQHDGGALVIGAGGQVHWEATP